MGVKSLNRAMGKRFDDSTIQQFNAGGLLQTPLRIINAGGPDMVFAECNA